MAPQKQSELSLSEWLTEGPPLFRAPPFTPELVKAISRIAPQYPLRADEMSRLYWQTEQNATCLGECQALDAELGRAKPKRILEIGPGLGRSVVYFMRRYSWDESAFDLYEGEGTRTRYTTLGPRFRDSFCGNFKQLRTVLEFNGVKRHRLFDARKTALGELPGEYDLLYSFYSIGFHWKLEHFWDELAPLLSKKGKAIFIVAPGFEPFPALARYRCRLIAYETPWPRGRMLTLLVVENRPPPKGQTEPEILISAELLKRLKRGAS